jgi:hypothetical protein
MLTISCQLRAANVNSTLYLIQSSGKSVNSFALSRQTAASTLALLVFLFTADHVQDALASHDFAVTADFFD